MESGNETNPFGSGKQKPPTVNKALNVPDDAVEPTFLMMPHQSLQQSQQEKYQQQQSHILQAPLQLQMPILMQRSHLEQQLMFHRKLQERQQHHLKMQDRIQNLAQPDNHLTANQKSLLNAKSSMYTMNSPPISFPTNPDQHKTIPSPNFTNPSPIATSPIRTNQQNQPWIQHPQNVKDLQPVKHPNLNSASGFRQSNLELNAARSPRNAQPSSKHHPLNQYNKATDDNFKTINGNSSSPYERKEYTNNHFKNRKNKQINTSNNEPRSKTGQKVRKTNQDSSHSPNSKKIRQQDVTKQQSSERKNKSSIKKDTKETNISIDEKISSEKKNKRSITPINKEVKSSRKRKISSVDEMIIEGVQKFSENETLSLIQSKMDKCTRLNGQIIELENAMTKMDDHEKKIVKLKQSVADKKREIEYYENELKETDTNFKLAREVEVQKYNQCKKQQNEIFATQMSQKNEIMNKNKEKFEKIHDQMIKCRQALNDYSYECRKKQELLDRQEFQSSAVEEAFEIRKVMHNENMKAIETKWEPILEEQEKYHQLQIAELKRRLGKNHKGESGVRLCHLEEILGIPQHMGSKKYNNNNKQLHSDMMTWRIIDILKRDLFNLEFMVDKLRRELGEYPENFNHYEKGVNLRKVD